MSLLADRVELLVRFRADCPICRKVNCVCLDRTQPLPTQPLTWEQFNEGSTVKPEVAK